MLMQLIYSLITFANRLMIIYLRTSDEIAWWLKYGDATYNIGSAINHTPYRQIHWA